MGNNNSSSIQSAIPLKLGELAYAVESSGDAHAASILWEVSRSRDLLGLWRTKLISGMEIRSNPRSDSMSRLWFRNWESNKRVKLSEDKILNLENLTKHWRPQTEKDIPQRLDEWIANPISNFWGEKTFVEDTDLVEHCLGDIEEAETTSVLNPIRRRVLLLILYDIIRKEEKQLRKWPKPGRKKREQYLTQAINRIVDKSHQSRNLSEEDMKCKRKRCKALRRYGQKWSLFIRREAILDFPLKRATDSFERAKLEKIEIEALNSYEETMYDNKYRSKLRDAFQAVYNSYESERSQWGIRYSPDGATTQPSQKRHHNDKQTSAGEARKRPRMDTRHSNQQAGILESDSPSTTQSVLEQQPKRQEAGQSGRQSSPLAALQTRSALENAQLMESAWGTESTWRTEPVSMSPIAPESFTGASGRKQRLTPPHTLDHTWRDANQNHFSTVDPCAPFKRPTMRAPHEPNIAQQEENTLHNAEFAAPYHLLTDIPQPEAVDAWAAGGMRTHSRGLPHDPLTDVPQPNATDAWAAVGMQTHSGVFPHDPLADVPQPNATDAWAAVGMQTHSGVFPHDPLTGVPQLNATDAWAAATSAVLGEGYATLSPASDTTGITRGITGNPYSLGGSPSLTRENGSTTLTPSHFSVQSRNAMERRDASFIMV